MTARPAGRTAPRRRSGAAPSSLSSLDGRLATADLLAPPPPVPPAEPAPWVALSLAALPVLVLAVMGFLRRWLTEDAFISLRVVKQILAGNGPVFNAGERVEAYTHPLWVALLTLWGLTGLRLEYGAVALGIACAVGGLVAAEAAALHLLRLLDLPPGRSVVVPLGAFAFVALPVVWDFTTSGLETGLAFGWLGLSYWLLVRCAATPDLATRPTFLTAFVLGLGVLVRPDLALFSLGFLAALVAVERSHQRHLPVGTLAGAALAAAALPLAYQLFRMGYFATLAPNTALAKEASRANWAQGRVYVTDFVGTYALWLPLLPLLGWWASLLARPLRERDTPAAAILLAPVVSALLHALYVVRVGGDFMHGRFLLPTLFGLLLPLMLVRLPIPRLHLEPAWLAFAAIAVVLAWAGFAPSQRVAYWERISADGLADERSVYTDNAGRSNPITLDDYLDMRQTWPRDGLAWRARADADARVLIVDTAEYPLLATVPPDVQVVALAFNAGLAGYAAGIEVHVADRLGLADPIASRLHLADRRRPGHEKELPAAWAIARFSDATPDPSVAAARDALGCGQLRDVLAAVTEPLSFDRFRDNLRLAWRTRGFRLPADPEAARAELCAGM